MGFFPAVSHLLGGFAYGHGLVSDIVSSKTYKLGQNHYLAVDGQFGQAVGLGTLALQVFQAMYADQLSLRAKILCNLAPYAAIPLFTFLAAAKEEHIKVPKEVRAALTFLADQSSEMMRAASIVGLIALIHLGHPIYGLAAFVAIGYDLAARNQWLSLDVRTFAETYFPLITLVGDLLEGTYAEKFTTLFIEPIGFTQEFTLVLQEKLDYVFKSLFFIRNPTLIDCHAPYSRPASVTADILTRGEEDFKVSAKHITKDMTDLFSFDRDDDFENLVPLFDTVNWVEPKKYMYVLSSVCKDDQFSAYLKGKFPAEDFKLKSYPEGTKVSEAQGVADIQDLKNRVESALARLAKEEGISTEQFLINYIRNKLARFAGILSGAYQEGDQHDIQSAREHMSFVMPILQSMDPADVLFQDSLLKLSYEAGSYCSEQLERASREVKKALLLDGLVKNSTKEEADKVSMEFKILWGLENVRQRIVQSRADLLLNTMPFKWLPDKVKKNMHIARSLETALSLGNTHISKHEQSEMSLALFFYMEAMLNLVMGNTRLEEELVRVFAFLNKVFGTSYDVRPYFKDMHKEYEERLMEALDGNIDEFEKYQNAILSELKVPNCDMHTFFRFTLYKLGVLELKQTAAANP